MSIISKSKGHVASVDETYFQHMCFALRYSMQCFMAGFMGVVHAFIPALCETGASTIVRKLAGCVEKGERDQL